MARFEGEDPSRDALLVHGHLDVVPADPAEWSVPPFAGEIKDGYLWGRGAIDMKDFDAMVLALVRQMRQEGRKPPRDVVLAFVADEEAGSTYGAKFLVDEHAGYFDGLHRGDRRGRRLLRQPRRRPSGSTSSRRPRRASTGCACTPAAGPATAP